MRTRAFTLVELLIVIIIVAVLAAVAIPKFVDSSNRAKESSLRYQLKLTRSAVDRFYADTGFFPRSLGHLGLSTADFDALSGNGINPAGTSTVRVPGGRAQGPYAGSQAGAVYVTPDDGLGAALGGPIWCPKDPVTGGTFYYRVSGGVATIRSTAAGNDSKGVAWSTY